MIANIPSINAAVPNHTIYLGDERRRAITSNDRAKGINGRATPSASSRAIMATVLAALWALP
jgi:hypothetical protein